MKVGKFGDLECSFEMEYDEQYYQIEAYYGIHRDTQSHEFGTRILESAVPVGFLVFTDGAQLLVTDADLMNAIWRECDRYADRAR